MNQSFDAGRWWLLVGKHWSENKKKYTLSLVAIGGLLLLWFGVIVFADEGAGLNEALQISTYYFGLYVVGCLYGSMLFADLGSKTRGLNYLVVPASQFEKLLCALFYAVVVFLACYTIIFYAVDIAAVKLANTIANEHWLKSHAAGNVFVPRKLVNVFYMNTGRNNEPEPVYYLLLGYLTLQALFILGSVYFVKFNFIKTVIAGLLIGLVVVFLVVKIIAPILPPGSYYHGINTYQVYTVKNMPAGEGIMIYSDADSDKLVSLPDWISSLLLFLLKYAFAPLFWMAAYYRVKEKEI